MKVKVVFYSMYGHIYRMAEAVAEGAREVEGAEVELLQVPELIPDVVLEKSGAKKAREAFAHIPVAKPANLADADAIIFGTPTRFGNMCAQMRSFLDQTEGYGHKMLLSVRWAASLPLVVLNMAGRRQLSPVSTLHCFITG